MEEHISSSEWTLTVLSPSTATEAKKKSNDFNNLNGGA